MVLALVLATPALSGSTLVSVPRGVGNKVVQEVKEGRGLMVVGRALRAVADAADTLRVVVLAKPMVIMLILLADRIWGRGGEGKGGSASRLM